MLQLQIQIYSATLHYTNYTRLLVTLQYTNYTTLIAVYTTTQLQLQLHYITLHYSRYTTLLHNYTYNYKYNYNYNYTTQNYITLLSQFYTRLHYNTRTTLQLQLRYFTLHETTLHYTTLQYTTLQYTTLHELHTLITPRHNNNCNSNYTTIITLHYNYNSTTLHYIQQLWVRWPLQPLQPLQKKTQLQPHFRPSVDSLCHPCITTTHLSYSVLSLKLPPPPCAVLLVW